MGSDLPKVQKVSLQKKEKKRTRGRPPKIPILPLDEKVEQLMKDKAKHLSRDSLLAQLEHDSNSIDVLDVAMKQLAQESASLEFEQREAERKGRDPTAISGKRITAIKTVIDTYLKKKDTMLSTSFDLKDKRFQKLFEFWASKIRKCCEKIDMSEEQITILFQVLADEFEDWEKEAYRYIKTHM
jgi:hypothetical protein